jgi:hypothetical protein
VIRVVRNLFVLGALALLAFPASAAANPVGDCAADGDLDREYSNSELKNALDNIPAELDEYSNCREIISGAIRKGSDKGGGRPTTGAGGSAVPVEEQDARVKDAGELEAITGNPEKNPPRVEVGGKTVEPGSNGLFDLASASNDLPVPLLVALIALGVLALTGGLVALRGRIPLLARIPLVSKIPAPRVPFRFRR